MITTAVLRRRFFLMGPLLVLMLSSIGWAQQGQEDRDQVPTFRANVSVVNLFFNAKDRHGALLPDLKESDFNVFEDGTQQKIKYFSSEANQPLTLGVLIDTSGSQQRVLPMTQEIGESFLKQTLREKDMAFVISFDVNVELLQDFTNSSSDLRKGLERAKINTGGGSGGIPGIGQGPVPVSRPKGTLLYDAIYLASDEKLKQEVGRKAIVILTDGEDQGSQTTIKESIEAAQKADAIVYVLFVEDRESYAGFGKGDMKKVAEETGGRVIDVGNKPEKLREAFDQISKELRTQYNIGYTPTNSKRDGTYRKVEIKPANKDIKIQARKGYYAPKE